MAQQLKTILKEREVLPTDILEKIKKSPTSKLRTYQKADIIIDRFKGKQYRQIAKEKKLAVNTILKVIKDNKELMKQLETRQAQVGLEKEEKLILRLLDLIEKKISRIENSAHRLDFTRLTELATTLKELFNKVQIQKGQPTAITQKYSEKETEEIKKEIITTAYLLKEGQEMKLMKKVFEEKDK